MVGEYEICVRSNRVEYDLKVRRKFTIITGESGSGKTRLNNIILDSQDNKRIKVSCNVEVIIVTSYNVLLKLMKTNKGKCIYLIDERVANQVDNEEFASLSKKAERYFILITRRALSNIPYSALEIFTLKSRTVNRKTVYTQESVYCDRRD